ncbi:14270_t:CDS:2 [Cetraspora pellucida]|uniref:14270_t:CDS:1 n=1 Tax=Cetraspora pellucida TaxID=1433469 RepID=A0A9N9DT88_9GLOM|nr:14270_t:CDS:2 [Cetraspora pellucida]
MNKSLELITTKHYDPLSSDELRTIFNHEALSINTVNDLQNQVFMWCCLLFAPCNEHNQMKITQFTFLDNGRIQFTKFSQKNDSGGVEENLDSLIIPVPADLKEYLGPVHDIKLYLSKRSTNYTCQFLHFKINKNIHDIL